MANYSALLARLKIKNRKELRTVKYVIQGKTKIYRQLQNEKSGEGTRWPYGMQSFTLKVALFPTIEIH